MISWILQPRAIELFSINQRMVGVETDGTDPDLILECLIEEKEGFSYNEVCRLIAPYVDSKAYFNVSKFPDLTYDLPNAITINNFGSKNCIEVIKPYRLTLRELLGDVQQGSSLTFEGWALRGGVEPLTARGYVFDDGGKSYRILTNHPSPKKVSKNQPEWLYFLFTHPTGNSNAFFKVRITFSDGTTDTIQIPSLVPIEIGQRGKLICVSTGYYQLGLYDYESSDKFIVRWDVWLDLTPTLPGQTLPGKTGQTFSYQLRFDEAEWKEKYFLFLNQRGGMDTLCARGKATNKSKGQRETSSMVETLALPSSLHITSTDKALRQDEATINTGWLELSQRQYLRELLNSKKVWQVDIEDKKFIPITLTSDNLDINQDDEEIQSVSISFTKEKAEGL